MIKVVEFIVDAKAMSETSEETKMYIEADTGKKKKKLPIREPIILPFEPKTPIELIDAAVKKALSERFPNKREVGEQDKREIENLLDFKQRLRLHRRKRG